MGALYSSYCVRAHCNRTQTKLHTSIACFPSRKHRRNAAGGVNKQLFVPRFERIKTPSRPAYVAFFLLREPGMGFRMYARRRTKTLRSPFYLQQQAWSARLTFFWAQKCSGFEGDTLSQHGRCHNSTSSNPGHSTTRRHLTACFQINLTLLVRMGWPLAFFCLSKCVSSLETVTASRNRLT